MASGIVKDSFKKYIGPLVAIGLYWRWYGGWGSLLSSLYLHLSIVTSIIVVLIREGFSAWEWFVTPLNVLPNTLGFSLGGYAIIVGFGDKEFISMLCGGDDSDEISPFQKMSSAFMHFIFIQFICLLYAFICSAVKLVGCYVNALGLTLFVYSLYCMLGAALAVLNLSDWYHDAN